MCLSRRVLVVQCVSNCNICTCVCVPFLIVYTYIYIYLGSLKFTFHTFLKVTFVSCFFAKKIQSSEDMGSSPVRLAGEVVSARQEVLQVQEVAAKKTQPE